MKSSVLLGIVSKYVSVGYFNTKMRELVSSKSNDSDLSSDELKLVYEYIADCQQKDIDSGRSDLSIREMKGTILKMIGANHVGNKYSPTVSRDELKAIYNFIVSLPSKVFLEVIDDKTNTDTQ